MNLQNRKDRLGKRTYGCCGVGEGTVREFGMDMYTLLCLKWITNKDLLYNTWNSAQCYVPPGWEGGLVENGYTYMCG